MPRLEDPIPRSTGLLLREAVRRHVIAERRRRFAPVVHVGRPGGPEWSTGAVLAGTDHALRTDVMSALLTRPGGTSPMAWLTRPGELTVHDVDAAWLSAAIAASEETGGDLCWVVVTRRGWWDPRSGLRREWVRMRP